MQSNKFTSSFYKNKIMDSSTYALRKRVMKYIYEAKKLDPNLPRLDVRITDNHERVLGSAKLNANVIWISERAITKTDFNLRTVVFHEIVHAAYGIGHNEKCPLMRSDHRVLIPKTVYRCFRKYIPNQRRIK